jgi:hypothetical protein
MDIILARLEPGQKLKLEMLREAYGGRDEAFSG